jgi:hypothetical protein
MTKRKPRPQRGRHCASSIRPVPEGGFWAVCPEIPGANTKREKFFDYSLPLVGTAGPAVRTPFTEMQRFPQARDQRTLPIGSLLEVQILLGVGITRPCIRRCTSRKSENTNGQRFFNDSGEFVFQSFQLTQRRASGK